MKYSRKLKTSVLTIVLTAAFVFNAIAQQEAVKLTPFTGMDFVRIVVDDTFKQILQIRSKQPFVRPKITAYCGREMWI